MRNSLPRRPAAPAKVARRPAAAPDQGRPSAQLLENLQSTAGNAAVANLLHRRRTGVPGAGSISRAPANTYIRVAGDITSTFESGGDYAKLQTRDAGVISYGKHQATLAGGNLYEVVKDFTARSQSETATELAGYIDRLKAKDASLAGDQRLLDLLRAAGQESAMRVAQDAVFKRKYWDKAAKTAKGAGISSALGYALLYDTTIQGGAHYRMKEVRAKLGGDVGDVVDGREITEHEFLTAFVEARIAAGIRQSERDQGKGRALLARADGEADPAKAAALRQQGKRLIANGKAMLVSATKTRGPTWKALVDSGDLDLRGDATGAVALVGKKTSVRGLGPGATIDATVPATASAGSGPTRGSSAPAGGAQSAAPAPAPAVASPRPLADVLTSLLPVGFRGGQAVEALLRSVGADPGPALVTTLASAGFRDLNKLTNIVFWLRHPELAGTKLDPAQPGFAALSAEWLQLRDAVVAPALQQPQSAAGTDPEAPRHEPPPPDVAGVAERKGNEPAHAPSAPPASDAFVKDWAASTIDRLPPAQRTRFEKVRWGRLDFPGTKVFLRTLEPAAIDWWRTQPSVREDVEGGYFTGSNQGEAEALLKALASVRPGGGERRVNIGADAVLTKEAFRMAPDAFDEFVAARLAAVPGQTGHRLHGEAATAFADMRAAAAQDGVPLVVLSSFRPRKSETKAAKAARNPKAVGSFSPHSLGLAVDLRLHVKGDALTFTETSTMNFNNMLSMLRSPVYKWVYDRGAAFNFYQYRAEPWHWEYNPSGFKDRFFDGAPELQDKVAAAAARSDKG